MMHPIPNELAFRKSSYSQPTNCVEVADLPNGAAVRDSESPWAGHLTFPAAEWNAFLSEIRRDAL